jgi:hypothetical protein
LLPDTDSLGRKIMTARFESILPLTAARNRSVTSRIVSVSVALLLCTATLPLSAPATAQAFPDFQNQNSATTDIRSAIVTADRVNFLDSDFANLVNNTLANGYNEVSFAFMQCFGGGMIDDLLAQNLANASYTSATRHDRPSFAGSENPASGVDLFNPIIRRVESFYNLPYAPAAGGANPATQRNAAMTGFNGDILSPPNLANTLMAFPRFQANRGLLPEVPQYTSSDAVGDSIMLHRVNANNRTQNTRYRAILFGGSTRVDAGPVLLVNPPRPPLSPYATLPNLAINWATLNRVHDALLAAGYTEDEMYVMYPGGEARDRNGNPTGLIFPGGPRLPDWVDAGTRAADLRNAFTTWLAPELIATTQVFFWSSWGHGKQITDWAQRRKRQGQRIPRTMGISVDVDPDFTQQMQSVFLYYNPSGGSGDPGSPLIELTSSIPLTTFSLTLDGNPLTLTFSILDPYGDGSEYLYKYALSRADMSSLAASTTHTLAVDYPTGLYGSQYDQFADFIQHLGPTMGDFANGLSLSNSNVSEPVLCDVDLNRRVDRNDISAIFAARNTPAMFVDPRDADGDGTITVNDARICSLLCTKPTCAP